MKGIRKVIGMGIMALTDLAVGIFVVHVIGKFFSLEVPIYFYPIGMFLALLPDLDYAYKLWQKWRGQVKVILSHKSFLHYPIFMIVPICSILDILSTFWPIFSYWGAVAFFCLLSHYIHDTIEGDTGIRWLFPIYRKYYRLCSFNEDEIKGRIIMSDTEWFDKYYLRPSPRSIFGVILFIDAVLIALFG